MVCAQQRPVRLKQEEAKERRVAAAPGPEALVEPGNNGAFAPAGKSLEDWGPRSDVAGLVKLGLAALLSVHCSRKKVRNREMGKRGGHCSIQGSAVVGGLSGVWRPSPVAWFWTHIFSPL